MDAFVDGELPADRRTTMLEHVRACPECGPHAALLLAVRASLVRSVARLAADGGDPARLRAYGQGNGWGGGPG